MKIALCGMMGSGKTTVAKILAENSGAELIDTDEIIVVRHGEINAIFMRQGEQYFRKLEEEVIAEISAKDGDFIVALGGGAVLSDKSVTNLKRNCKLVYLRTKAENLTKRLDKSTDRPLLQGTMRDRIMQILDKRAPIYESVADAVVDTDGLTPQQIAKIIGEMKL